MKFKEKGILSGKKMLAATIAIFLGGGVTIYAAASSHTWASTGNVVYDDNGTQITVFNKDDLDYLNDRIDAMESSVSDGKNTIAQKLNEWELDEPISEDNPSFEEINTALEYIKSIPNVGTEWKDSSDNPYYVKEDGSITTDATEAKINEEGNVEPIKIAAATAGNLSAGSAAWVDGSLLIGTGADNKNYYNFAYTQGIADGLSKADVKYIYHEHSGDSTTGTGCYTSPIYHTHTNSCYTTSGYNCGPVNKVRGPYKNASGTDEYQYSCSACGRAFYLCDGGSMAGSWHYVSSKVLSCGKTTTTIDSYSLGCGKTEESIESAIITF